MLKRIFFRLSLSIRKNDDRKGIGKLRLFINGNNNEIVDYVTLVISQLSKSHHLNRGKNDSS